MVSEAAEAAYVLCLERRLGGTPSTNPLPFTFNFLSLSKTLWLAVIDFQNGEQQSRSGSDKKRRKSFTVDS